MTVTCITSTAQLSIADRLIVKHGKFCDRFKIYHSSQNVSYWSDPGTRETLLVVCGVWYKGDLAAATGQILSGLRRTNDEILEGDWYVLASLNASLEKMEHLKAIQEFATEMATKE